MDYHIRELPHIQPNGATGFDSDTIQGGPASGITAIAVAEAGAPRCAIRDEAILPDAGSRLPAAAGMGVIYMPIYLDRHDLSGLSPSDVAEAHRKDLELQDGTGCGSLPTGSTSRGERHSV